jgi:hypothetical protein
VLGAVGFPRHHDRTILPEQQDRFG